MKVKVTGFSEYWSAHQVEGETTCMLMDLLVNGDFSKETKPEDLIGKTIEFSRTHPFIEIAYGCRIVDDTCGGQKEIIENNDIIKNTNT